MIAHKGEANLQLENQLFADTSAAHQLVVDGCRGRIEGCTFTDGNTALHATQPVDCDQRSLFNQIDGGGLLVLGAVELVVSRCRFQANHAMMCGGAVSLQAAPGSRITFENCDFVDNTADDTGPAIDLLTHGLVVALRNCRFTRNGSTGRLTTVPRGQVSVFPGNVLELERCTFEGNKTADVDYHQTKDRPVTITTDPADAREYRIIDVTGMSNRKLARKIIVMASAWANHPAYFPARG
ncbi:MAG TPA: right-handed parallel beta-helix repeat-containing protein [Candidatus Saccharimonadales bacterium]|nr:right-handed parallel beta-helix repeat-containing protein [Candidatus Saccharimonadales bacterium]